jgi:hypothetical protein
MTYFRTHHWEIQGENLPPCEAANFVLAKPINHPHNFQAASIFWDSFQWAVKAGFYNYQLLRKQLVEDRIRGLFVSVVKAQIGFQDLATTSSAMPEDCLHYRQERSNARRIAVSSNTTQE